MRVIVTGSRKLTDGMPIELLLRDFTAATVDGLGLTVVHGGCPTGADHFASRWCVRNNVNMHVFRADWGRHGKAAGPIRNREMIAAGADLVLAFPLRGARELSAGTWDCVDAARAAGLKVEVHQ